MYKLTGLLAVQFRRWRLSLFEKVILANSVMLIIEALAGLWVTSHTLEAHHYLIDTAFLSLAALLGLAINVLLLRASFRPLFALLSTMRAVSAGKTSERAAIVQSDAEINELAQAFNGMLDRLEATRREQAMLILQAQEEERHRLALELHDESSQNLTALLVHIEILSQSFQAFPDSAMTNDRRKQLDEGLRSLTGLTQLTLENIRTLAQQLRPTVLDDLGLKAAFRWLAEDAQQRLNLAVKLEIDGVEETAKYSSGPPGAGHVGPPGAGHVEYSSGPPGAGHVEGGKLPALYETALFRIAQECLTNVARHAHAQNVFISLTQKKGQVSLWVRDDGCGYDPSQQQSGLGIFGMHERANLLGGTVHIQSQAGHGTTVEAILPLPVEHAEEVAYA